MLRRSLLSALVMSLLSFAAVQAGPDTASRISFAPGQVWSIKSVPTTTAKVVICRIEPWKGKTVVHVSIIDVPIPQGVPGAGGVTSIGDMPFDESALAASVDQLVATGASPAPSFEAGYEQWKDAKGGIFTTSVPQAIKFVFDGISRGHG